MKRAVSWCLLVLLSCVGLVACGTGPAGPSPSPPPTTPASATASPSPSAVAKPVYKPATATSKALNVPVPVMPEAAKRETPEGAKAFVGYWVAMLSYAYETGDVRRLRSLAASTCTSCDSIPADIEHEASAYSWQEGGRVTAPSVEARPTTTTGSATVVAQLVQYPYKLRSSQGAVVKAVSKQTTIAFAFRLTFGHGGWIVADLGQPQ